ADNVCPQRGHAVRCCSSSPRCAVPPGPPSPLASTPAGGQTRLGSTLPKLASGPPCGPPADSARHQSGHAGVAALPCAAAHREILRAKGLLQKPSSGPPVPRVFKRNCSLTPSMRGRSCALKNRECSQLCIPTHVAPVL